MIYNPDQVEKDGHCAKNQVVEYNSCVPSMQISHIKHCAIDSTFPIKFFKTMRKVFVFVSHLLISSEIYKLVFSIGQYGCSSL